MGNWPRLVNLRRCARGHIFNAGTATNTTIALHNVSSGAELLIIWQLGTDNASLYSLQTSYQQGYFLAQGGVVQAIVPGDAPPPGDLSSGDSPTAFAADWETSGVLYGSPWPATFPYAVLQPGWSLVCQVQGGGPKPLGVSFMWEAILPKYFDRFFTHQYLEIELALQGG